MKIGVLSDTHLTRVTPEFKRLCATYFSDADLILHAGDMVGAAVYEYLQSFPLEAVQGNMDEGALRGRLPGKKILELEGLKIGLIHGWGPGSGLETRLRPEFEGIDCLVYGHSHRAVNHVDNGLLFFNPGSASGVGFFGKANIGFLHIRDAGITGEILDL
ncbi:MAG: metallophosphoesterase family protein [Thermodesulfobacteriota bacterium]